MKFAQMTHPSDSGWQNEGSQCRAAVDGTPNPATNPVQHLNAKAKDHCEALIR
jgi:hypothetical protein